MGNYRTQIKQDSLTKLDRTHKYTADLQKIYDELPQDLRGRWKVGNTDTLVTDDTSRMAPANRQMNGLIDKLLMNELKDDYQDFLATAQKMDGMMAETHGNQHKGQEKWSEAQDKRPRKELANGIYRQFNEQLNADQKINDGKFHKQAKGNFEKVKQRHEQPKNSKMVTQHKTAPVGKLNKIAKRMTKQSRQEIQQMHRMLQDTMLDQAQSISDESLFRHL